MKKSNYKIGIIDPKEEHAYLCKHLEAENNEVRILSAHPQSNLYTYLKEPAHLLDWNPDFVLFTVTGMGSLAYRLYSNGVKVVAGGLIQDNFVDPNYVQSLANRVGLPLDVSEIGDDYYALLFSKVGFCGPALRMMLDDRGVVYLEKVEDLPIFHALQKITSAVDFCGWLFISVTNGQIKRVTPYTPPGFWAAFLEGLKQPLGWMLQSLAFLEKRKRFRFQFTEAVVGAAKVTIPPYPLNVCWENLEDPSERDLVHAMIRRACKDIPLSQDAEFYPLEVTRTEDGQLHATGTNVGWVTASGYADTVPLELSLKLGHVIQRPKLPDVEFTVPQTELTPEEETAEV